VVASPRAWPVADLRLSRVLSLNRRLRTPAELAQLLDEIARGLAPGGRAVLLTPAEEAFGRALEAQPRLTLERSLSVREGGAARRILVLRSEPHPSHHLPRTAGDRERATRELGGVVARRRGRRPRSHDRADTDSRSGERGTT
jgi:SAM-dependent methyltransferase